MLRITGSAKVRERLRTAIALLDFFVGVFLFFGGANLAYHEEAGTPGENRIMGIIFVVLGLCLLFGAHRIIRKRSVGFRPFVYLAFAVTSAGLVLLQYIERAPPVSYQDVLGLLLLLAVVAACITLQRILRPQVENANDSQSHDRDQDELPAHN
jgi:membrane-bound acyltransferase YfiQ involved in biofilm formation